MADTKTVYLITGASSGIGLELAKQLCAQKGNKVFATVRKKQSSMTEVDEISQIEAVEGSSLEVLEGIDVAKDSVGEVLTSLLPTGATIDVCIHNAGSLSGTRHVNSPNLMADQKLEVVTMERMRMAFEVNTLGPLRVQQAILGAGLMKKKGGKVAIISTGLSSIADNTSGGNYAYRTSKAGVNMIAKCMSCDLKKDEISVISIAPGFVATQFGPGKEKMESWVSSFFRFAYIEYSQI